MSEIFDDGWSDAAKKHQALGKAFEDMYRNGTTIKVPMPIGYLKHAPTGYSLAVYKPISRFKALMLRWCFGLNFEKI